ncbi:ribonucleases P/MRP protein subunit POP5 [Meredithblackwellia eburnea MCA 4105]
MVRFKNRYLLVSLIFPSSLPNSLARDNDDDQEPSAPPSVSEGGLIHLLRESLSVNFGDVGAGEVGGQFSIKYLSPATHLVIIRVSREHLRTLWASLTLLRRVAGHEVVARVLHVSGTIRKIQHSAIAHDRAAVLAKARSSKKRGAKEVGSVDETLKANEEAIMALEA